MIAGQSLAELSGAVGSYLSDGEHEHGVTDLTVSVAGRDRSVCFVPLGDAGGRDVGDMVILRDLTTEQAAFRQTMLAAGGICVAVCIVPTCPRARHSAPA